MNEPLRIIRRREVRRRTGLSETTIWRKERDRTFPQRVKLNADGSAIGYLEHEVDQWVRDRVRGAGKPVRRQAAKPDNNPVDDSLERLK
jgi:prophage regulatory protein